MEHINGGGHETGNLNGNGKGATFCRARLEPQLEEDAALWTASERREMAKLFRRWARQLEVSAVMMEMDRRRAYAAKPTPSLKVLPPFLLRRN